MFHKNQKNLTQKLGLRCTEVLSGQSRQCPLLSAPVGPYFDFGQCSSSPVSDHPLPTAMLWYTLFVLASASHHGLAFSISDIVSNYAKVSVNNGSQHE